jgi:hypothetical protein
MGLVAKTGFQGTIRAGNGTVLYHYLRAELFGLVLLNWAVGGQAAVEITTDRTTPAVFGNGKRIIHAQFHNPEAQPAEANLRFRFYQASGSTLMPLSEARAWKTLTLTPGQTVLETLEMDLPHVRGETVFQVVWYDGEKKLGATQINAFPDELLKPLALLAGETPLGLLDPEGHFKAALGSVPSRELKEAEDVTSTDAQLILIAPMTAESRPAGLAAALKKKAANGCAVVWIQPIQPLARRQPEPLPDAYVVGEGSGRIVVAIAATVSGLADSPRAQLNLVRLAELATGKKQLALPHDL